MSQDGEYMYQLWHRESKIFKLRMTATPQEFSYLPKVSEGNGYPSHIFPTPSHNTIHMSQNVHVAVSQEIVDVTIELP